MKLNKFKLYLYFCMSAFFLLLTLTLYYSFGYKYNPSTGQSFQTGAIVILATPNDAKVSKDGQEVVQGGFLSGILQNFVKIEDLEQKSYDIKVYKDGYNDWEKNVQITPGQVEKYESVVLLKKEYKQQPMFGAISLNDPKKFWISTDKNRVAFYGTIGTQEALFMMNLENEDIKPVVDKSQFAIMGQLQDVKWVEDDGKLVVRTSSNLYVIDLGNNNKAYLVPANVSKILNQNPQSQIFVNDKFIIYPENNNIWSFNYITKETKEIAQSINNFYVYQGSLYYFKTEQGAEFPSLFSIDLNNPLSEDKISNMPADFDPKASFTVERYGNYMTVLSAGNLYLTGKNLETVKINSNVKDAKFFMGGKALFYFNDNEIWAYYIEDKISQPIKSQGENDLLTRFSGKISNIYLYSDDEHIFFQENNELKFAELDDRDRRNIFDVLNNTDNREIFYARGRNALYYIKDNKIFKIDLKEL